MTDDRGPSETVTRDGRPTAVDPDSAHGDDAPVDGGERYRVLRRLGKGGMGEVMLVRDQRIGREVALKRIRKASPSERARQRFLREASVQVRLEHPAIVPLFANAMRVRGREALHRLHLQAWQLRQLVSR